MSVFPEGRRTRAPRLMNYSREITADGDDALSMIADQIVAASEVLDLGGGNGSRGRYVTSQRQGQVDGADFSE